MHLLGIDLGSSSVKVSLLDAEAQTVTASASAPKQEMSMISAQPGWAEQDPADWWTNFQAAMAELKAKVPQALKDVKAIGISYQMHGLVIVDENLEVLRPSIIWCDSRAVSIGEKAFKEYGEEKALKHFLNSPGNFTASKLKWVKDNEEALFKGTHKFMLPGDWMALRLTGTLATTPSGLSEGILWDFLENAPAESLLQYFGIEKGKMPEIIDTFSIQGELSGKIANELGLPEGTPVSYRAGDQPNNAFSLNVLNPGEVAATAGTSGVVYGINDQAQHDPQSRVNTFVHVNHTQQDARFGVLACINGTGILNSWVKRLLNLKPDSIDYPDMNNLASQAPIGSEGLVILPFGNGAERTLANKPSSGIVEGVQFNTHGPAHFLRAVQEGIVFAMKYSMDIMKEMGIDYETVRVGKANMFLSPVFRDSFAGVTGANLELYDTDGAQGAARGAGIGAGVFKSFEEAFSGLKKLEEVSPKPADADAYQEAYEHWKTALEKNFIEG